MEHKVDGNAHAIAVVAGQQPNCGSGGCTPQTPKGPFKFQAQTSQIEHPRDPISSLELLGHSNSCTITRISPKIFLF
ncbi:hypothetical protein VNO77_16179 [Canavalia gladiata]|uniref:Uncharacterized protein n=1 Tax=Canavalia gladiata TaxID=3824 RepID=A0AAN9QRT4_CANGL